MAGPIEVRRILFPTDFSEESRAALPAAVALSKWYGSQLELLYVYPVVLPPYTAEAPYFPVVLEPTDAAKAQLLADLEALGQPARGMGLSVKSRVETGSPEDVILSSAQRADLVVMGTHGRGGFDRWVLGSTTEKVLAQAPCSILTVGPSSAGAKVPEPPPFKRIVCGLDLSPRCASTLDFALSLAQEAQAHLQLLTVVEDVPEVEARHVPFDVPEYRRYRMADALEALRKMIPPQARDWCRIEERVEAGKAYRAILRASQDWGADLVVVGAHGDGSFGLGSTTQHVVRAASCPVLSVR
jgi:nucleotide-binding universal stress UspA family protein